MDLHVSEDFASSYVSVGLNNIVARETRVESQLPSVDKKSLVDSITSSRSIPYNPWLVVKNTVAKRDLAKSAKMARKFTEHSRNISLPCSAFGCSNSKLKSLSERRGFEFPGLAKGVMSAIHLPRMDSRKSVGEQPTPHRSTYVGVDVCLPATIPGRFPLHERSHSAADEANTSILSGTSKITSVSEPFVLFPSTEEDLRTAAAAINDRLKPVIERTDASSSSSSSQIPQKRGNDNEERPPVPPKSPSLATRLATAQQERLASKYSPPSSKITLKIDTSVAKKESFKKTVHITNEERHRPRASTALGIFPPVAKIPQPHKRSESASVNLSSTKPGIINRKPVPQEEQVTGVSIINRGRPNKRHVPFKRPVAVEQVSFAPLPAGFDVSEAIDQLVSVEVDKLQRQARNQAQKFKVLNYSDVRRLSLELRVLDERYEYLRNTHQTLRLGRSHLHQRMIAFLRSPRSSTNFREIMLRQEKALAELDHTIDEWYLKLEQVENRRSTVRQKLLEHIAGSLIMAASPSSSPSSSPARLRQQTTPPQSPTIPDAEVARESIKIYAESGVYADADIEDLLADIERQMEEMNSSRESSPCIENGVAAKAFGTHY